MSVKALACERPESSGVPLARWSASELAAHAIESGLVARIGKTTVWRWLHEDAIGPWQHRCWLFPRDPFFEEKAGRILDLYQRTWQGCVLADDEFVLSADEKTSIQARDRIHETYPPVAHSPMKVEHEYRRHGAWTYLAALDVHRAKVFGRCEARSGIASFDRLVDQVMEQSPYRQAQRVFWIVDNGSSHRGQKSVARLCARHRQLVLVHGPVHASWLNQIEIYFSILQRKVLTPNDFPSLSALSQRLAAFERHYEKVAKPFRWEFTRRDLALLLNNLSTPLMLAA
ncbi:MAG TPA: IS630 family transposase [Chthoniobacterales bacterium]